MRVRDSARMIARYPTATGTARVPKGEENMATAKASVPRMCPECRRRQAQQLAQKRRTIAETGRILARITAKMDAQDKQSSSPTDAQAVWYRGYLNWGW